MDGCRQGDRRLRPAPSRRASASSRGMSGRRRPASCPRMPGGRMPVAGTANLPSAAHTKSWLRVTPASARRRATFPPRALFELKSAKYVPFFGVSTRPARKRGSRRIASRSCGERSRASSISPARRPDSDRRRAHSGPELDPVEARGLLPVVGVALEDEAVRRSARHDERARADRGLAASFAGHDLDDRRQDVRQESGEDRERLDELELQPVVRDRPDPGDVRGLALPVLRGAADRRECGRHPLDPDADRPLERGLHGRGRQRGAVREADPLPEAQDGRSVPRR